MKPWLALLAVLAACRGDAPKAKRTSNAAPVEVIAAPQLADAGAGEGAIVDEIEPNDGDEVATPLPIGGTARGKIEPDSDVDYYRIEIEQPAVLSVTLGGVEGMDLQLELVDASGTVLAKSDRGGARTKEGIPNAGLTPGNYALVVKQYKKKPARTRKGKAAKPEPDAGPAPVYELTAQLVDVPKGMEREPDDDRGTANDLIVGDAVSGYIGWSGDHDVWKLFVETLSENNLLDVHVSAIEGSALEVEISDGIGRPLATRKAPRGQPLVIRALAPKVPPGAPPFHYLTVRADKSNPETPYTLQATARLVELDEEIEPNDLVDRPYMVPSDRTVVNATWSPGDVDCFGIAPAGTARQLDVTLETPAEIDLDIELLVDGQVVAVSNKGGKGVAEKLTGIVPANARPVLRVKNPGGPQVEAKYSVSIRESTATEDNAP